MPRPSEGTIDPRGRDRWRIRVTTPSGGRVSRTVTGTKTAARQALDQLRSEVQATDHLEADTTLADFLARWWEVKRPTVSPNTVPSWNAAINNQLVPILGHIHLRNLRRVDIDVMVADLRATLGVSRIKSITMVLGVALGQAVEWDLVTTNVAHGVKVEGGTPPEVNAPSVADVKALLAVARRDDPEMAALIVVAADTGIRRGGLCGIKWRDVDLARGVLAVRRAVAKGGGGGAVVRQTKTGARSILALSEGSVAALRAQLERQTVHAEGTGVDLADTFVFGGRLTEPVYPDTITARFRDLCRTAGVTVQLRELRHFTATQLLTAGVDIRTVSGRLQHGRTSTTLDRYADWVPAADFAAAAVMDSILAQPSATAP